MRVKVKTTDIFVIFRVNTLLSFCKNVDITYNVSSNPPTPQKTTLACIARLCFCFLSQVRLTWCHVYLLETRPLVIGCNRQTGCNF